MFLNISHKSYRITGNNSIIKLQGVLFLNFGIMILYSFSFTWHLMSLNTEAVSSDLTTISFKTCSWELFYIILRYAFNIVQFSKNNENKDRPLISEAYFHYYHHKELHAFSFFTFLLLFNQFINFISSFYDCASYIFM